ncbi:MFS transporter [Siminovitchia sp. 179-K 8D1 HS]|uniref:MFS transporter n=1 Tax=Siminovitchia sp. 179-K 8D1 HS TaxID=3142385 RepID=UPI0039A0BA1A
MKSKNFRLLWMGQLFANLGDVFYIVGLISILYAAKGSAFYLAMLPFLNTFGRFVSGMVSPILLNRYRLTSLLAGSQFYKTIVLFGISVWVGFKADPNILPIFICIFIIAFLDGWAAPATKALIPRLVGRTEFVKANSFMAVINETTQLGGWALGGILVAIINGQNIIWLTFVLFAFSTMMMKGITDETPLKPRKLQKGEEIKEGWLIIWRNPLIRTIHVVILLEAIANVVWVAAILYVFVTEMLSVTEAYWGYINAFFFAGLIAGGLFCSIFALFVERNMKKVLITSSIGIAVLTAWFGVNNIAWLALILVACSGFLDQIKGIVINTSLQKNVSVEQLPKIYSAQHALISFFFGISTLVFGTLAELVSVQLVFIAAGMLLAVSGIYVFRIALKLNVSGS